MTYEIEFILNVIFVDFAQELMSTQAAEPRDPRNYAEERKKDKSDSDGREQRRGRTVLGRTHRA